MRRRLAVLGLGCLLALPAGSEAAGSDPIVGFWNFHGGVVQVTGSGTSFTGTVVTAVKSSGCIHPVGEVIWRMTKRGGGYVGTYPWYGPTGCRSGSGGAGPSFWVLEKNGTILHFCTTNPGRPGDTRCYSDTRAKPLKPAPATTAPRPTTTPKTTPTRVVFIGNDYGVQNGPTAPSIFTTTTAWHVVEIWTYHWNDGKGTSTPGTIAIKNLATGKVYGPWKASGRPGQGGVPNAYWVASVSFDLPAGRYQFLDSDPSTWAQNAQSGHQGMAWIMATRP